MRAVLLAAGRGKRLGSPGPKCLLCVGGKTLLERHVENLVRVGVGELTVVLGYGEAEVRAALDEIGKRRSAAGLALPEIEPVVNDLFEHGSLVSLARAAHRLEQGGLWMDADVLYPAAMLERIVGSKHPCCVLLDGRSSENGEEMMLAVRAGRVERIGRRVGPGWDLVGESVGFFKVDAYGGQILRAILEGEVRAGRLDQEHEQALELVLGSVPFGFERVDDLSWTEIDFPEDVTRAERLAQAIDADLR